MSVNSYNAFKPQVSPLPAFKAEYTAKIQEFMGVVNLNGYLPAPDRLKFDAFAEKMRAQHGGLLVTLEKGCSTEAEEALVELSTFQSQMHQIDLTSRRCLDVAREALLRSVGL